MAMPNTKLIGEFMTQLETPPTFWAFLYKMAARGHFVFGLNIFYFKRKRITNKPKAYEWLSRRCQKS